jgi:FkbM family methyltransferase
LAGKIGAPLFDISDLQRQNRLRNENTIRSLSQCVAVSATQALTRVLGCYKMYVDPSDFGLSPHLMLDGFWEMDTTEVVVQLLRPGMVAADVGANVGYFTMLMAGLTGPSGRVLAFEPNPSMAERIVRSASLNGMSDRIEVYPVALSNRNEAVCYVMPSDEPKNAYILPFENNEVPSGAVVIDAERLDSRLQWADIEFLKIDAEGAEEKIWEGASGLRAMDKLKILILEFQPGRYADPRAYLNRIMDWGFSLSLIDQRHGLVPTTAEAITSGNPDRDVMLVFQR